MVRFVTARKYYKVAAKYKVFKNGCLRQMKNTMELDMFFIFLCFWNDYDLKKRTNERVEILPFRVIG